MFSPKPVSVESIGVGEVGFVIVGIKNVGDAKIGGHSYGKRAADTGTTPGFMELKPMVFAGLYPVESHQYQELREALEKLQLNDSSFFFEPRLPLRSDLGFAAGS